MFINNRKFELIFIAMILVTIFITSIIAFELNKVETIDSGNKVYVYQPPNMTDDEFISILNTVDTNVYTFDKPFLDVKFLTLDSLNMESINLSREYVFTEDVDYVLDNLSKEGIKGVEDDTSLSHNIKFNYILEIIVVIASLSYMNCKSYFVSKLHKSK